MRTVLILLGCTVLYIVVSRLFLYHQTQSLFSTSNEFAKTYTLGTGDSLSYLVLGDSTAVGTGVVKVEESYPYAVAKQLAHDKKVTVTNCAVIGAKLTDLVETQLACIDSAKPNIVSISIGANDATHFTSYDSYQKDLQVLRQVILKHSSIKFFIANTPDMSIVPALPQPLRWLVGKRATHQNSLLGGVFPENVSIVDIYNEATLRQNSQYAADRFHPSQEGYVKWSAAFISATTKAS